MRLLRSSILIACFSISLHGFSQTEPPSHTLKVRLTKAFPNGAGCGVLALASAMKYEVIESSFADLKAGSFVVLIQPCPEMLGDEFFISNKYYKAIVSKERSSSTMYIVTNPYEKDKISVFWIQQIESIIK